MFPFSTKSILHPQVGHPFDPYQNAPLLKELFVLLEEKKEKNPNKKITVPDPIAN